MTIYAAIRPRVETGRGRLLRGMPVRRDPIGITDQAFSHRVADQQATRVARGQRVSAVAGLRQEPDRRTVRARCLCRAPPGRGQRRRAHAPRLIAAAASDHRWFRPFMAMLKAWQPCRRAPIANIASTYLLLCNKSGDGMLQSADPTHEPENNRNSSGWRGVVSA